MANNNQGRLRFTLHPVGIIKNEIEKPVLSATEDGIELTSHLKHTKEHHQWVETRVSEIEIYPEYDGILDGIEDFSHIMVLYWPHLIPEECRRLRKVHPMGRKEFPEKGIFSTCSPVRPNPVLITTVRLLSREGLVLKVRGLEAVNESPLIDIKPFVPKSHSPENVTVAGWMKKIHKGMDLENRGSS